MNEVVGIEAAGNRINDKMLNRILALCDVNFEASLDVNVEEHRLQWTTFANLSLWLLSWDRTIIGKGFGHRDDEGNVIIPPDQLRQIFNVDESAISLDGSSESQAGGLPTITFHDKNIPKYGKPTTKSSTKIIFIGGINAAGEPIPAHFQLPTGATIKEIEKIRIDCTAHLMST